MREHENKAHGGGVSGPPHADGGAVPGRVRTDRLGRAHVERARSFSPEDCPVPARRRHGPVETGWEDADDESSRRRVLDDAMAGPSPVTAPDPEDRDHVLMTWTVREPGAVSVLLDANGLFAAGGVEALTMTRLAGTDVWTCTWSVPADWCASYGIAAWRGRGAPPWCGLDGRPARLAIMRAAGPDPRASRTVAGSFGPARSVAAGPDAPAPPWEGPAGERRPRARPAGRRGRVHELSVPMRADAGRGGPVNRDGRGEEGAERVWVYEPGGAPASGTPVLLLFDGQIWLRRMGLVRALDALIASGELPPLHVAMVDSRDQGDYRAEHLGVPGGQVDLVIDGLLPVLHSRFAVSPLGADTIVSGQSYGALASLWALALADGEIGHAIALSPSLWRFDVGRALAACPRWLTARLLAGTFEGRMLVDARALAHALRGRDVAVTPVSGGHDWAWWSVRMILELVDLLSAGSDETS